MSYVSEIRDICGDYAIDIKYHEEQKEAITLFFNSRRNAETVKRCIEVDDSVPNAATAVDFVEVIRCKDCKHCHHCYPIKKKNEESREGYYCNHYKEWVSLSGYCSYGGRREE